MSLAIRQLCAAVVFLFSFSLGVTAQAANVTIRWSSAVAQTDIRFEGEFTFSTDDPSASTTVDLLAQGANTDVVVTDGVSSETWSFVVPPEPFDYLEFLYCPGGEAQCGRPPDGTFLTGNFPTWEGTPLDTDCGAFTEVPCTLLALQVRGGDPPVGRFITSVGDAFSNSVTFEIVVDDNEPPTADAGEDQNARAGTTVSLDGTGSFDDNTATSALIPAWSIVSAPAGSTAMLTGDDSLTPTLLIDVAGTYEVELIVTDTDGSASTPDSMLISNLNMAPAANAGPDQLAYLGSTVNLDGSGSSDPEGDTIAYGWEVTTPSGGMLLLAGVTPSLTVVEEGVYVAELTVSDFLGANPLTDTTEVTAASPVTFAVAAILDADELVAGLDDAEVTTAGNQNALTNFLAQAVRLIQRGNTVDAIERLQHAALRTDGCIHRGLPDTGDDLFERDWVLSCAEQADIFSGIAAALDALNTG